jgi:hypothetical protein
MPDRQKKNLLNLVGSSNPVPLRSGSSRKLRSQATQRRSRHGGTGRLAAAPSRAERARRHALPELSSSSFDWGESRALVPNPPLSFRRWHLGWTQRGWIDPCAGTGTGMNRFHPNQGRGLGGPELAEGHWLGRLPYLVRLVDPPAAYRASFKFMWNETNLTCLLCKAMRCRRRRLAATRGMSSWKVVAMAL